MIRISGIRNSEFQVLFLRYNSGMSLATFLRSANPLGPIFEKELRVTARRKRSYFLRVGYLGVLLLLMFMVYSATMTWGGAGGAAARSQQSSELGMAFFMCFSIFSVFTMGVIGPVLTSTAIGSEKLQKTLPVLLMTPISAWQIVSGKLFSRLLAALTLIGLSLPVLALVRLLGGVDLEPMFGVICLAASVALSTAALGLFLSTFINRAYAVILLAYFIQFLFYMFVPFAIVSLVMVGARTPPMRALYWVGVLNPYMMAPSLAARGGLPIGGGAWIVAVAIQCGIAALLLVLSALVVRRSSRRVAAGSGFAVPMPMERVPTRAAPALPLAGPGSARPAAGPAPSQLPVHSHYASSRYRRSDRVVSNNPVLWRELRKPLLGKRSHRVLGALAVTGLLLLSYALFEHDDALRQSDTQITYAIIFNGFFWIMAAVVSATSIAHEKESDTWTLLMTTPLSSTAIVWGKTLGVIRRLRWPVLLLVAHLFVFWVTLVIHSASVLLILAIILCCNTLWIATGIYLSLQMSKTTVAVVYNLLLAPLLYGLPFGILTSIDAFTEWYRWRHLGDNVGWYLPYYYLIAGVEGIERNVSHMIRIHFSKPTSGAMSGRHFFCLVAAVCAGHVLAALLVLWHTSRRLDRFGGRAIQRHKLNAQELRVPGVGPLPAN